MFDHIVKLLIEGQPRDEAQRTKLLGIIIDNQLTWKWHIYHIAGKITRGIGMVTEAMQSSKKSGLMPLY